MNKMQVVLASNNPGKAKELNELLKQINIELIPQSVLGIAEIEETGASFIENALIKARHAARVSGLPAIADDSGLSVAALKGAPGIYSARYAGPQSIAQDNIKKLLFDLRDIPDDKRQAYFYCVLVFMLHANDPTPIVCQGKWSGAILSKPRGEHGFGYDPIFYVPSEKKSAAELTLELKNQISHRATALQLLLTKLVEIV